MIEGRTSAFIEPAPALATAEAAVAQICCGIQLLSVIGLAVRAGHNGLPTIPAVPFCPHRVLTLSSSSARTPVLCPANSVPAPARPRHWTARLSLAPRAPPTENLLPAPRSGDTPH